MCCSRCQSRLYLTLTFRMNATYVITLAAPEVQAALCASFYLAFVHKVYLDGVTPDRAHFGEMLAGCIHMARHTSIVVMRREAHPQGGRTDASVLLVEEYKWSHSTLRPWGNEVPIQCPTCGALGSLKSKSGEKGFILVKCINASCRYVAKHSKPDDWQTIKSGEGGTWAVRHLA